MKIDRAFFLALTGTLAGAACGAEPPPVPPPGPAPVASAPTKPEGDKYERACQDDSQCDALAVCVCQDNTQLQMVGCAKSRCLSGWDDCQMMERFAHGCAQHGGLTAYGFGAAPPAAPPGPPPPPPHVEAVDARRPLRDDSSEMLSSKTFDPTKKSCGDDAANPPIACQALQAGPCVEGNGPETVRNECNQLKELLKPGAARRAFTCFARQDKKKNCSYAPIAQCVHAAVMDSCLDPTAEGACVDLSTGCSNVDQAKCMSFLSGMKPEGRRTYVAWLKQHCSYGFVGALMAEEVTAKKPKDNSPGF